MNRFERPNPASQQEQTQAMVEKLSPSFSEYFTNVPFDKVCTIVHHTLIANDELTPDTVNPLPGGGAIYRLIGDGTHNPTFSGFKESSSSSGYDSTLNAVNLITFLYDGIDFWYSINQAV